MPNPAIDIAWAIQTVIFAIVMCLGLVASGLITYSLTGSGLLAWFVFALLGISNVFLIHGDLES